MDVPEEEFSKSNQPINKVVDDWNQVYKTNMYKGKIPDGSFIITQKPLANFLCSLGHINDRVPCSEDSTVACA